VIAAAMVGGVVALAWTLLATSSLPEGPLLLRLWGGHGIVASDVPLALTGPVGAVVVWRLSRRR
jgi:hypothetical protein